MIKKYKCGKCNKYTGTRKGLRLHLREKHYMKHELANFEGKNGKVKQPHWIVEDFQ